jgi:hypothetical protein
MAQLVPPSKFFRIMPGFLDRRTPSAWHVLKRVTTEEVDEKKQDVLGWPAEFHTYRGACGVLSSDLNSTHEFRPVHDVPYKKICKLCWPYVTHDED